MLNNKGQAIVMLILIMTVALAIGLSIVQKSLLDVSTSSKVEQSSRAFSAAEAGIEKALSEASPNPATFTPGNNSSISSLSKTLIPLVPQSGQQDALEIPGLSKEDTGQVWLADYTSTANPPPAGYIQQTLDVYWGTAGDPDYAALELTLVYYGADTTDPIDPLTNKYRTRKWYLDSTGSRNPVNGFESVANCAGSYTIPGASATYRCKRTLGSSPDTQALPSYPILLRARLLYNTSPQPFAVRTTAAACVTTACTLPPQETVIDSVGIAGETQRKVKVTQTYQQVPNYFDYAIFSAGDINK